MRDVEYRSAERAIGATAFMMPSQAMQMWSWATCQVLDPLAGNVAGTIDWNVVEWKRDARNVKRPLDWEITQ